MVWVQRDVYFLIQIYGLYYHAVFPIPPSCFIYFCFCRFCSQFIPPYSFRRDLSFTFFILYFSLKSKKTRESTCIEISIRILQDSTNIDFNSISEINRVGGATYVRVPSGGIRTRKKGILDGQNTQGLPLLQHVDLVFEKPASRARRRGREGEGRK